MFVVGGEGCGMFGVVFSMGVCGFVFLCVFGMLRILFFWGGGFFGVRFWYWGFCWVFFCYVLFEVCF